MRNKSVLFGKDYEALNILIPLHCHVTNPKILDCTHNKGVMWKGCNYSCTSMDIDPQYNTDVVGDFMEMPFEDVSYDAIVFDPPFIPASGVTPKSGIKKFYGERYGITESGEARNGDDIVGMFKPFLLEAKRVLVENGIVIAKLGDVVFNHRYRWHQVDFINAVREVGMTPCDMMIIANKNAGNLNSGKWKNAYHLRRSHSYFIVVRNSKKCERCKV